MFTENLFSHNQSVTGMVTAHGEHGLFEHTWSLSIVDNLLFRVKFNTMEPFNV